MHLVLVYFSIIIAATLATRSTERKQRRLVRRQHPLGSLTKIQSRHAEETLRDRWIEILQSSHKSKNAVRLESYQEEEFYYSVELLADRLLGFDEGYSINDSGIFSDSECGELRVAEVAGLWALIAIGSSGILLFFPLSVVVMEFFPVSSLSTMGAIVTSFHSSITPHLIPTVASIQSSMRNGMIQTHAIVHSLPYLLRHLGRIRLFPLIIKIVRKCIIIEAWRHIWIRLYKITKRLWSGVLSGSSSAYTRLCPAWIRRGIRSMLQSMVQSQVQGVMGGAVEGALGVTFECLLWSSEGPLPEGIVEDVMGSPFPDAVDATLAESCKEVLESTIES